MLEIYNVTTVIQSGVDLTFPYYRSFRAGAPLTKAMSCTTADGTSAPAAMVTPRKVAIV